MTTYLYFANERIDSEIWKLAQGHMTRKGQSLGLKPGNAGMRSSSEHQPLSVEDRTGGLGSCSWLEQVCWETMRW